VWFSRLHDTSVGLVGSLKPVVLRATSIFTDSSTVTPATLEMASPTVQPRHGLGTTAQQLSGEQGIESAPDDVEANDFARYIDLFKEGLTKEHVQLIRELFASRVPLPEGGSVVEEED
jgi:hypothetical protein